MGLEQLLGGAIGKLQTRLRLQESVRSGVLEAGLQSANKFVTIDSQTAINTGIGTLGLASWVS